MRALSTTSADPTPIHPSALDASPRSATRRVCPWALAALACVLAAPAFALPHPRAVSSDARRAFAEWAREREATLPAEWDDVLAQAECGKPGEDHDESDVEEAEAPLPAKFQPRRPVTAAAPGLSPIVRVNDPSGDAGNETQSETSIAVWGRFAVAVFNDSKGFNLPPTTISGVAYSTDGGETWTDGGSLPLGATGQLYGDPSVVVDSLGNFTISSLYFPNYTPTNRTFTPSAIGITRGRFVGEAPVWQLPVAAVSTTTAFLDKELIAVNPSTGALYCAYVRFGNTGQIECVRSTDLGATWSAPVVIQPDNVGDATGALPLAGTNGEVYVVYENFLGVTSLNGELRCAISTNGGVSFAASQVISPVHENWYSGAPGFNRLDGFFEFPACAVDWSHGPNRGSVYLAWHDATVPIVGPAGGVLNESEPNSLPGSAQAIGLPQMVGGAVASAVSALPDSDYFAFSGVAGQMVKYTVTPSAGLDLRVQLLDGANADSILCDTRYGAGGSPQGWITLPATQTYYVLIRANAASTGANGSGTYTLDLRTVTATAGTVARDHRDIVMVRTGTHGAAWSTPVRLNDDAPLYDQAFPMLAVDSLSTVHAFWYDRRDGGAAGVRSAIYATRSTDGGATWAPNVAVSDAAAPWQIASRARPNVGDYSWAAASGRSTYPLFADSRGGSPDAYTVRVQNGVDAVAQADTAVASAASVSLAWHARNLAPFADSLVYTLTDSLGWFAPMTGRVALAGGETVAITPSFAIPATTCAGAHNTFYFDYAAAATASFTARVVTHLDALPANHAPAFATLGAQAGLEGAELTFGAPAGDADGDAVTYSVVSAPAGFAIDAASGACTWTPGCTAAGDYTATLQAADPCGAAAQITVALNIAAANCAPEIAAIAPQIVTELGTLTVTPAASDGDGDALAWTGGNLPLGAVVDPVTGEFAWTPMLGAAGSYSGITLTADDGHGGVTSRSFDVTVTLNATGIDVRFLPAPASLRIAEAVPNPFVDKTTFIIGMPRAARGVVSVWNAKGQRIAVWPARTFLAGYNPFVWDGRDLSGRRVPGGVYLVRVESEAAFAMQRVTLVR